jgi:hypothetical protein
MTMPPVDTHSHTVIQNRSRLRGAVFAALIALIGLAVLALSLLILSRPLPFRESFEGNAIESERWQIDADDDCEMELTSSESRLGRGSLRISAATDLRCELVPRTIPGYLEKVLREPFGTERWYRFSVLVADFDTAHVADNFGENTVVAQWHASPDPLFGEQQRGPPLALRIFNGEWWITYGWDTAFRSSSAFLASNRYRIGPVEPGAWVDWSFRVSWSYRGDGLTEVRKDGELVFERSGPNAFNDVRGVYLKLGLYDPTSDMTAFLDEVLVTTEAADGDLVDE